MERRGRIACLTPGSTEIIKLIGRFSGLIARQTRFGSFRQPEISHHVFVCE